MYRFGAYSPSFIIAKLKSEIFSGKKEQFGKQWKFTAAEKVKTVKTPVVNPRCIRATVYGPKISNFLFFLKSNRKKKVHKNNKFSLTFIDIFGK